MQRTKFLTGRQRVVFEFIRQRIENGMPPTFNEISEHFGFHAKPALDHCIALKKKGFITWEYNRPRTITLLPPYKDDTRHSFVVKTDVPELDIRKGDFLHIDTGKPIADGNVILSVQGEIKRFCNGDTAFGKVLGFSRPIGEL